MDIEGKNRITGRFAPSPSGRMHVGNLLSACWRGFRGARRGAAWSCAWRTSTRTVPPGRWRTNWRTTCAFWGSTGTRAARRGDRTGRITRAADGALCGSARAIGKKGVALPLFLHARPAPCRGSAAQFGRGTIYSGRCRGLTTEQIEAQARLRAPAVRLRLPDETVRFVDGHYGPVEQNLARECGDIILRRSDGVFAYQLAVVLDDIAMGVTQVVRGRDLLSSTPRQMYLYRLFGASPPQYIHVPLLLARMGGGFPSGSTTWTWALCGRTGFPARRSWAGWPILRASPPSASRPPARPAPPVFLGKGAEGKPGAPGGPVPGRPIGLGPVCRPGGPRSAVEPRGWPRSCKKIPLEKGWVWMEIRQLRETEMEEALQLVWRYSARLKRRSTPRRAWRNSGRSFKTGRRWPGNSSLALGRAPAYRRAGHERAAHQPVLCAPGVAPARRGKGAAARDGIRRRLSGDDGAFLPYAVEVYRRFGFVPLGGEREENGIRYTPMVCRHWTF